MATRFAKSGADGPAGTAEAGASPLIYRTKLPVRIWHWINALSIFVMLMSGMMIFNAHPRLYWGVYGANLDHPWLVISHRGTSGFVQLGGYATPTPGLLRFSPGMS